MQQKQQKKHTRQTWKDTLSHDIHTNFACTIEKIPNMQ